MFLSSVKTGAQKGVQTTWMLTKIIVPVYACVVIVKHTPLIIYIQNFFKPLMKFFGLPGEGVIPIITGIFVDEYGAIAGMKALSLSVAQITTISVMVLFAHSLFIETAIVRKLGLSVAFFSTIRLILAIVFGIIVGVIGGIL